MANSMHRKVLCFSELMGQIAGDSWILSLYFLGPSRHVNYQHRKRLIVHHKLHSGKRLPYFCLLLLLHEKNDLIKNYVCKMFLLDLTCLPTVPSLEKPFTRLLNNKSGTILTSQRPTSKAWERNALGSVAWEDLHRPQSHERCRAFDANLGSLRRGLSPILFKGYATRSIYFHQIVICHHYGYRW